MGSTREEFLSARRFGGSSAPGIVFFIIGASCLLLGVSLLLVGAVVMFMVAAIVPLGASGLLSNATLRYPPGLIVFLVLVLYLCSLLGFLCGVLNLHYSEALEEHRRLEIHRWRRRILLLDATMVPALAICALLSLLLLSGWHLEP